MFLYKSILTKWCSCSIERKKKKKKNYHDFNHYVIPFQMQNHVNPALDFTQTPPGMLALDNMLYLAKVHQDTYIRVSLGSRLIVHTEERGLEVNRV